MSDEPNIDDETPATSRGGEGGILGPASQGGRVRADMRVILQAVERGWNVPQDWQDKLPKIAAEIAVKSDSPRDRLRALEVLRAFTKDKTDAAVKLNEIYRHEKNTDDMAARIADDIRNRSPVVPTPAPGPVPAGDGPAAVQGDPGGAAEREDDAEQEETP